MYGSWSIRWDACLPAGKIGQVPLVAWSRQGRFATCRTMRAAFLHISPHSAHEYKPDIVEAITSGLSTIDRAALDPTILLEPVAVASLQCCFRACYHRRVCASHQEALSVVSFSRMMKRQ